MKFSVHNKQTTKWLFINWKLQTKTVSMRNEVHAKLLDLLHSLSSQNVNEYVKSFCVCWDRIADEPLAMYLLTAKLQCRENFAKNQNNH